MSFGIPVRNGLGVGLLASTSLATRNRGFSPASLFAAGEQGYWLDPSDFSTMFQDTAGATPVTAVGQSVRRINDKSGRGNNFTQANVANAPILGVEPFGGRRNLLTFTEQFDNAAWTKTGGAISATNGTAPDGTATADVFTEDSSTGLHFVSQLFTSVVGTYAMSCYVKASGRNFVFLYYPASNIGASFNLTTGAIGQPSGTAAPTSSSAQDVGNGWWRISMAFTGAAAGTSFRVYLAKSLTGTGSYTGNGTSGILIWGAQLETGSTATAYQRVTDQWNVTQAGVADCYYLSFDGTDDWLQSAATINPGAVDKAQVFAGVRRLTNAAYAVIAEASGLYDANNGAFTIGNTSAWLFGSKGNISSLVTAASAPPITSVLTGLGDISGDSTILRVNGVQAATSAADQGTGNYLTYTHYLGRRGGTTLPFNGRIYQMVMRYGPNLTAGQITQTETFVNSKTGAY